MALTDDEQFERARRELDPIRQAQLAGELITLYQQRSLELARLRRVAINRAVSERGISFSTVAAELGLTRGRISQIRKSAPPEERAFFGVGPIVVAVPLRSVAGRALPMISSEDTRAAEQLTALLQGLAFQVMQYRIPPDGLWTPPRDTVAICGPKSSPVTAELIMSDPFLSFEPDETGRWIIRDRQTGKTYESPMDADPADSCSDVAYVGRLGPGDPALLVIAGVHALGSVGAVSYLVRELRDLYRLVGTQRFSLVVGSNHDGEVVTQSELLCTPRMHQ